METKNKSDKTFSFAVFLTVSFVLLADFAGAVPSITSWNSTGGTTTNKDNNQE